ncbi:MAG: hypothetical protein WEC33_08130, partial [Dehalococcoidia bacterium]
FLSLYHALQKGGARTDPGAIARAAILRALRPLATLEDQPLFEAALGHREATGASGEGLGTYRAAALIALDAVAPGVSVLCAVGLLTEYEAKFDPDREGSGEPALTAVRVLAANDQLPLVLGLLSSQQSPLVRAECLRSLITLDPRFLTAAIEAELDRSDPTVLLGVYDLLIGSPETTIFAPFLHEALRSAPDADLYRYLATDVVASRKPALLAVLHAAARLETRPAHLAAAVEALQFDRSPESLELLALLQDRLRRLA